MNTYPCTLLDDKSSLPQLAEIPQPPQQIFIRGKLPPAHTTYLAIVGSRSCTSYGRNVVSYLVAGLAQHPISIVSGLALGIDASAHEAALESGLHTLAIPGSGLDDSALYPRSHRGLAQRILLSGGGLLSEYNPTQRAAPWTFPQRNRIMAGIAHAVLLIEATPRSGTLITARLASEYNRDLLVVPGSIFSPQSAGTHQFLKLGATPVTTPEDILEALHIEVSTESTPMQLVITEEERQVLLQLNTPCDQDTIIRNLPFPPHQTVATIMNLRMRDVIIDVEENLCIHPTYHAEVKSLSIDSQGKP